MSGPDPWLETESTDVVLQRLDVTPRGLSDAQAQERLRQSGANMPAPAHRHREARLLLAQFRSPVVVILALGAVLSVAVGEVVEGSIILAIVLASAGLGFWQERSAGRVVNSLLAQVRVGVEVRRGNRVVTIPLHDVVPGEVVVLNAGDVIPGDGRVLEAHRLLVDEASLTGEPYPAEKEPFPEAGPQAEHRRSAYMGTHVLSGTGTVVIGRTGSETMFGRVVLGTGAVGQPSSFERGVSRFGLLLARAATVLIAVIFGVNLLLERPLVEAFLFSLALAVGLTPQLLPAIVAVSLASGARRMARDKVIVRRMMPSRTSVR